MCILKIFVSFRKMCVIFTVDIWSSLYVQMCIQANLLPVRIVFSPLKEHSQFSSFPQYRYA